MMVATTTQQNTPSIIVKDISEISNYSSVTQIYLEPRKLFNVDLKWLYYCGL